MRRESKSALTSVTLSMLVLVAGCVTPIEVKQASKTQLELLGVLGAAVVDLQSSLDSFHKDKQARIRQEGRIWIARQAIEVSYPLGSNSKTTADMLFETHKRNVQPWIDYAFLTDDVATTIRRLDERLKTTIDPSLKVQLTNEKLDWERLQLVLANKPSAVKQIEAVITDDLQAEQETAARVDKVLDILRAQIASMKELASRVDAWLAIDVTITQEQADALKSGFSRAASALGGNK